MAKKQLTGGIGGNLNNATDGFGAAADTITVLFENPHFDYEIFTYANNDIVNLTATSANGDYFVITGSGADSVNGGSGQDIIYDGSGNDRYFLSSGIDVVNVGTGNDTYNGGAGAFDTIRFERLTVDTAKVFNGLTSTTWLNQAGIRIDLTLTKAQDFGAFGKDVVLNFENVTGGFGNDSILGSRAANTLDGSAGNDWISGRIGADLISGGAGSDWLIGGFGADRINLLDGTSVRGDRVIYASTGESGLTDTTRDQIQFFTSGVDKIDLSRIDANTGRAGNQGFAFTGEVAAFTQFWGEVRYERLGDGSGFVVYVDTDADADAEMTIFVGSFGASLLATDFIL